MVPATARHPPEVEVYGVLDGRAQTLLPRVLEHAGELAV